MFTHSNMKRRAVFWKATPQRTRYDEPRKTGLGRAVHLGRLPEATECGKHLELKSGMSKAECSADVGVEN